MVKVSPSLLSANFAIIKEEMEQIEKAGADWLHYDVMDGHFVPNISFGYSILNDVNKVTDLFIDVHLMISDPFKYVDNFIKAGADLVTFHYESVKEDEIINLVNHIKNQGVQVGITIKPATPIDVLEPFLKYLDLVLVMSVEPGFGGQKFNPNSLDKIKKLAKIKKEWGYNYLIEVDGGINQETGLLCKQAGVDVLVAGSYIFGSDNYQKKIESLK